MNLDQVTAVGRRRKQLEQQLDQANTELKELCRQADKRGVPRSHIAEAAQIPRMTLHRWLEG